MLDVPKTALQRPGQIVQLGAVENEQRLRLAVQGAACAIFDWNVGDGVIHWDGATDITPFMLESGSAARFLDALAPDNRATLKSVVERRFCLEVAAASPYIALTAAAVPQGADWRGVEQSGSSSGS